MYLLSLRPPICPRFTTAMSLPPIVSHLGPEVHPLPNHRRTLISVDVLPPALISHHGSRVAIFRSGLTLSHDAHGTIHRRDSSPGSVMSMAPSSELQSGKVACAGKLSWTAVPWWGRAEATRAGGDGWYRGVRARAQVMMNSSAGSRGAG